MKIVTLVFGVETEELFNYLEDKYDASTDDLFRLALSEYFSDDISEYRKIKERRA